MTGPTIDHREIRRWADRHQVIPTELLPHIVDHEPAMLQLMLAKTAHDRRDLRVISWDEFFARFDLLGLAFVYDDASDTGYNELLQRDEKSPHISQSYRPERLKN